MTWGQPFEEFPESAWHKILNLNVVQIFNLTRACMPLLEAGSGGKHDPSHVINIGSVGGDVASISAVNPSYLTSKAGVQHLSRVLAGHTAPKGLVTVNCLQPGIFPSKMSDDFYLKDEDSRDKALSAIPVGRIGSQEDMAGMALFLSSKASAFVTGQTLSVDGGQGSLWPAGRL